MIYAELSGGLGNQMFVYAFARAMGLCCQEPVTLIDRQDWKTGSPAHTALALQALHISSEVLFVADHQGLGGVLHRQMLLGKACIGDELHL